MINEIISHAGQPTKAQKVMDGDQVVLNFPRIKELDQCTAVVTTTLEQSAWVHVKSGPSKGTRKKVPFTKMSLVKKKKAM